MKNNDNHEINQGRSQKLRRTMPTDVLVVPEVIEKNHEKLDHQPRRRRRTNYIKKIMNDPFIMSI